MKLALDTQAYSAFCRGHERVKEAVRGAAAVILPLIVLGELRAVFLSGSQGARNDLSGCEPTHFVVVNHAFSPFNID